MQFLQNFRVGSILCAALVLFSSEVCCEAKEIEFNRDIRPILSENCFYCHGPDEKVRAGDLRLDLREAAIKKVILPGNAKGSELVKRITHQDAEMQMPPDNSERSLSAEQIDLLKKWIDEGAEYQPHWSLIPPVRPESVATSQAPIDDLIQQELANFNQSHQTHYKFAPEADRETLIRRVTFTLTGLPPTLEEIDAFLADRSPNAYEKVVDRLLASPRYGERMATDWLDVARYSDTYGFQVDRDRFVWPWRDWVIRAFNQNMPYDQFVREQLAGDLLPSATRDQILATTFNRLHSQESEGGSTPEEFRTEYVADRTQTVSTAFMGLTMECCRCHSHKYDPITHSEYYALSAFFDNIDEAGLYSFFTDSVPTPTLDLPTENQEAQLAELAKRVKKLEAELHVLERDRQEAFEKEFANDKVTVIGNDLHAPSLPTLEFAKPILKMDFEDFPADGPNQPTEGVSGKGVLLTGDDPVNTKVGNFSRFQPFSVSLWIKSPKEFDRAVVFHRSQAWTDSGSRGYQLLIENGKLSWSLIHFWPGNAIRIKTKSKIPLNQWLNVVVTNEGSSRAHGLSIFIDGTQAETEVVRDALTKNITSNNGTTITLGERFRDRGFKQGIVDQLRVFDKELTSLEIARLATKDEKGPWDNFGTGEVAEIDYAMLHEHQALRQDDAIAKKRKELQDAREALCKLQDSIQLIMVMRELSNPRRTYRLERGVYSQRAEPVEPGTPAMLPPFPKDVPHNRLGLAAWLTDKAHPLTSRVAVNRLWQICFGVGLVRTPEDFGSQGELPTHPELLDYLAVDFTEGNWDVKRLLKQIVLSKTFRQSSIASESSMLKLDPENRLFAYFPVHRLSAEMLRDNCLAISGRLVPTIGGPPARPYEIEASFKPQPRDKNDGIYRRSLYTYWKRTAPAPEMIALDASTRNVCRLRRERTTSPLQAFVLLNGPQYLEASRGLSEKLIAQHGDDVDAILRDAYRTLTSHTPDKKRMDVLKQLYEKQLAYFAGDDAKTKAYLSIGDSKVDASEDQHRLAATSVVISTLLNFDLSVMNR